MRHQHNFNEGNKDEGTRLQQNKQQRYRHRRNRHHQNRKETRGNIIISMVFVLFVIFLGLSLLSYSILHSRIQGARLKKMSETHGLYQELIYYIHHFRKNVFDEELTNYAQPETDYFNSENFPEVQKGNRSVIIKNTFTNRIFPGEFYQKTRINSNLNVSSGRNNTCFESVIFIDLLSGKIPLTFLPFFLNKKITVSGQIFQEENNVIINSGKSMTVKDIAVELDSTRFLADSLDISGTALTWRGMREKFGLDPGDEPVEEGIHRVVKEDTIRCLFIQGNVDKLVFFTQDNRQKFRIVKNNIPHEYFYIPGEHYFVCWDNQLEEPLIFMEKIVVNGSIWAVEQEGDAAFKQNSNLILYASGEVTIRSNLETEKGNFNVRKMLSTNLTLVSSFTALFGEMQSGVTVDTGSEATVQVSIITDGKLVNKNSKLKVSGSIFCKELENDGVLEITHLNSLAGLGPFFCTSDFKYIDSFLIHFIEEVLQ
ncbi:MAG: hypothetical protein GY757_42605 [bacterium]|nr:hypothetical protein [bacterium]